ncbi:MAG: class I SAM-dependent DNA methyltransferase [Myxococcota bacterium]
MLDDADAYGHVTARYYDAAYEKLRAGCGDVEFYRELAREAQGPVLELACGTGRVLLEIAKQGIPCTGLDASPRMLSALRRKEFPPTLRLVCAPMQDFDLGEVRYSLIFSAFRGFQHLYTHEDQLACLACVRRHLAPGGRFAFDVFSPDPERSRLAHEPEAEDVRFEMDGETIIRLTAVERDLDRRLLTARMRYERRSGNEVIDSERIDIPMRYFSADELRALMTEAGFDHVTLHGNFDRRPYAEGSPEIIVVAR